MLKNDMINYIKNTLTLALVVVTSTFFSGCATPNCQKILSISDNFTGETLGDHIRVSVNFTLFSFEREKVNDVVYELKHRPNLSLLIECQSSMRVCTFLIKNYLVNLGVDAGRIRLLSDGPEYIVLVMPSDISFQARDENKASWPDPNELYQ